MRIWIKNVLLMFIFSCKESTVGIDNIAESDSFNHISKHNISIIDTIYKYESFDSIYHDFNSNKGILREWFFLGEVNDIKFAIHWPIEFGFLYLYQKADTDWLLTDTIEPKNADFYDFNRLDVNFDGYKDLIIGKRQCLGLIYYPNKKQLILDSNFNLPQMSIDKKNKIIRTYDDYEKCRYYFKKGRLALKDGIEIFHDKYYDSKRYDPKNPHEKMDTLKYFTVINERRNYRTIIFDSTDIVQIKFETMLWNSIDTPNTK